MSNLTLKNLSQVEILKSSWLWLKHNWNLLESSLSQVDLKDDWVKNNLSKGELNLVDLFDLQSNSSRSKKFKLDKIFQQKINKIFYSLWIHLRQSENGLSSWKSSDNRLACVRWNLWGFERYFGTPCTHILDHILWIAIFESIWTWKN